MYNQAQIAKLLGIIKMKNNLLLHHKLKSIFLKPLAFIKDSKAVAAVEFAFIAPILLLLFVGTIEVSFLVAVDRKLSRTASTIADLVTQDTAADAATLNNFLGATERIMYPYVRRIPCVVISTIDIKREDTNNNGIPDGGDQIIARVIESVDNSQAGNGYVTPDPRQCNRGNANLANGAIARQSRTIQSEFPVPATILTDGTTLIVAEVEYDHFPIVGFIESASVTQVRFDEAAITIGDRIYLRPRS